MSIPATARNFALRHRINLGRELVIDGGTVRADCYFVRNAAGNIVEMTRSAKPTVRNAIAMMRRYLRYHA